MTPLERARTVAFQGHPGAYSHLACRQTLATAEAVACASFEDAFAAVQEGRTDLAMIPIENSVAGRVAGVHMLMPHGELSIVGETFLRVNHHLLAPQGTRLADLTHVHSHEQALGQCRLYLRRRGLVPVVAADTAGAAQMVAETRVPGHAAIASSLAGEIYDLDVLDADLEDADHNTTRFVILSAEPWRPAAGNGACVTTFVFRVRNVPAALYKALGGFATNGINMTKLESYVEPNFNQARFYADVIGHPDERSLANALEELAFFSDELRVLGTYAAHPFRGR
ncbi:MAG: prephenate dehydratase [Geminicoccaceae bacterium]|nr:MAG: prephenate dehydratase [Geminicoccaceae bacterium]